MPDTPVSAVLFACETNRIRSTMAEAWMKHFHGRRIYVDSCGIRAGEPNPFVTTVMEEVGIDVSHHRAKSFDDLDDSYFDLVVVLAPAAESRAAAFARAQATMVAVWPTADASAEHGNRERRLDAYRAVRDQLRARILTRFPIA